MVDIKKFQEEMEPKIMELYPDTTRLQWTYNVVRGGDTYGAQPAAVNTPHLDYTQDDEARVEFHERFPRHELMKEQELLLGKRDVNYTDGDPEMQVMLGVWKPIYMETPVCDKPLTVMDA